jgi:hypothetical protein
MLREWLADRYQRKMYRYGARLHRFKTGEKHTLDYHNWFTFKAERSIENQMARPSGREFLDRLEEKAYNERSSDL